MNDERLQKGYLPQPPDSHYAPVRRFTYAGVRKDRHYLWILSIFYYIVAGIIAMMGIFPGIYVALGIAVVSGTMGPPPKGPPPATGIIFIVFGSGAILLAEAFAICVIVAGRSLVAQKRYIFCFVVAVLLCLNGIPVMILGVFTIIVLSRESVKELFVRVDIEIGPDPDDD